METRYDTGPSSNVYQGEKFNHSRHMGSFIGYLGLWNKIEWKKTSLQAVLLHQIQSQTRLLSAYLFFECLVFGSSSSEPKTNIYLRWIFISLHFISILFYRENISAHATDGVTEETGSLVKRGCLEILNPVWQQEPGCDTESEWDSTLLIMSGCCSQCQQWRSDIHPLFRALN